MKKIANSQIVESLKAQPESGPVYAKKEDAGEETVVVDNTDIKLGKGQFGYYLTANIEGVGTRNITVRTEQDQVPGTQFRLEVWKAIRALPAAANRRAIALGAEKTFAIAI